MNDMDYAAWNEWVVGEAVPSMGATGICWDNAAAESFFATLNASS
jgi:hypothetical protein